MTEPKKTPPLLTNVRVFESKRQSLRETRAHLARKAADPNIHPLARTVAFGLGILTETLIEEAEAVHRDLVGDGSSKKRKKH